MWPGGGNTTASQHPWRRPHRKTPRDSYRRVPDHTQLLQTIVARSRESGANHRTAQGEPAANNSDNSKAIEELKASQAEINACSRGLPTEPAQDVSPPTQPTPTLRKPERTLQSPQVRARPRIPREWIYDDGSRRAAIIVVLSAITLDAIQNAARCGVAGIFLSFVHISCWSRFGAIWMQIVVSIVGILMMTALATTGPGRRCDKAPTKIKPIVAAGS